MGKKIKVLQITASVRNYGGISAMLFNIFSNINRNKFSFDFISPDRNPLKTKESEILEMGGRVLDLKVRNKNAIIRHIVLYRRLKKFLNKNQYDIIHINSGSKSHNALVSLCCKKHSDAKVIIHSHNANPEKHLFNNVLQRIIEKNANRKLSCSDRAAKAMFSNVDNVELVRNGIDTKKFKYNPSTRKKIRNEFKIADNEILIGNVGRLTEQKNQRFLIEIFNEYAKTSQAKLIIVGSGELESSLKAQSKSLGLTDHIIFQKSRDDMPNLYSAFDIFLLPSLYEGLPVSAIEAQASGLPTIISQAITSECMITNLCSSLPLEDSPKGWASKIQSIGTDQRAKYSERVKKAGFDISATVKQLEKLYEELAK